MADLATALSMAEELLKGIQASRNIAYAYMAGFTIICFDWLLTLDSEIEFVWNSKGKPMKFLYLFVRYLPFGYGIAIPLYIIGNYTASGCTLSYEINGTIFMTVVLCADLVLTIRTWAVWAKGKHMTYFLFGLYAMAVFLIIGFYVASLKSTHHSTFPSPLHGCYPIYNSKYLPIALVVRTALDTIVLVLMLIRGVSLYWLGKDSGLFRTIYSDGISFYVYNAALSIANLILLFGESNYSILLLMMEGALCPVLACRVVLHIRREYAQLQVYALPTNKGSHIGPVHRSVM